MDSARLLKLAEKLYATAFDKSDWLSALESVADALSIRTGHVVLVIGDKPNPTHAAGARVDDADMSRLVHHGLDAEGSFDLAALPMGRTIHRRSVVSDADLVPSEYYNEIIQPVGGFHAVFFNHRTTDARLILSLSRSRSENAFNEPNLAAIHALLPHFVSAVEYGHRLSKAERRASVADQILDEVESGVILVDRRAHPIAMNTKAARILSERDGISVETGGLAATTPQATRLLRQSIADASGAFGLRIQDFTAAASSPRAGTTKLLLARPSQRAPFVATLLPMAGFGAANEGEVAVFLREADAPVAIDRLVLADAFHLTAREADVACLIAEGFDPPAVAARLSIGVGTVRNHLKRVFDKTGAHSQAALRSLARCF